MNTLVKIVLLTLFLSNSGCNAAKEPALNSNPENENRIVEMERDWQKEGFVKGVIKQSKESGCPFVLILESGGESLDPINFDNETFIDMKKPDTPVYVKFRRLRMANRCSFALPVELEAMEEIKKE